MYAELLQVSKNFSLRLFSFLTKFNLPNCVYEFVWRLTVLGLENFSAFPEENEFSKSEIQIGQKLVAILVEIISVEHKQQPVQKTGLEKR